MKNENIINPINGKVSLFNEQDTYTQEATQLDKDFYALTIDFLKKNHEKYSSREIYNVLGSTLNMSCLGIHMEQNAREIRNKKKK